MTTSQAQPAISQDTPHQAVVELRRYLLHPGRLEDLIAVFDRHFVETQEACGMSVLGQFRDLDRPDEFVWLRGFADMETRRNGLAAFYDGPVWAAHGAAANVTMVSSDDVLLLKPTESSSGLELEGRSRPAPDREEEAAAAVFALFTFPLAPEREVGFPACFTRELLPLLMDAGAPAGVRFATEHSRNTYPRLPVREDDVVFVWIARFDDLRRHGEFTTRLAASKAWKEIEAGNFAGHATGPCAAARLAPTARSLVR